MSNEHGTDSSQSMRIGYRIQVCFPPKARGLRTLLPRGRKYCTTVPICHESTLAIYASGTKECHSRPSGRRSDDVARLAKCRSRRLIHRPTHRNSPWTSHSEAGHAISLTGMSDKAIFTNSSIDKSEIMSNDVPARLHPSTRRPSSVSPGHATYVNKESLN